MARAKNIIRSRTERIARSGGQPLIFDGYGLSSSAQATRVALVAGDTTTTASSIGNSTFNDFSDATLRFSTVPGSGVFNPSTDVYMENLILPPLMSHIDLAGRLRALADDRAGALVSDPNDGTVSSALAVQTDPEVNYSGASAAPESTYSEGGPESEQPAGQSSRFSLSPTLAGIDAKGLFDPLMTGVVDADTDPGVKMTSTWPLPLDVATRLINLTDFFDSAVNLVDPFFRLHHHLVRDMWWPMVTWQMANNFYRAPAIRIKFANAAVGVPFVIHAGYMSMTKKPISLGYQVTIVPRTSAGEYIFFPPVPNANDDGFSQMGTMLDILRASQEFNSAGGATFTYVDDEGASRELTDVNAYTAALYTRRFVKYFDGTAPTGTEQWPVPCFYCSGRRNMEIVAQPLGAGTVLMHQLAEVVAKRAVINEIPSAGQGSTSLPKRSVIPTISQMVDLARDAGYDVI